MGFYISDSQFNSTDSDMPDAQLITDTLISVEKNVDPEGVWIHGGNYRFFFWNDRENTDLIFCNAYVLNNPDDFSDSSTLSYSYYFEITKENPHANN